MKKGTRVEFINKNQVCYGVVEKGGNNKNTVVLDGGKREITAEATYFKESSHPLPKDKPTVMDKYSIKGYKSLGGEETDCFTATICLNGKPILYARNAGQGGCNSYNALKDNSDYDKFIKAIKEWTTALGYSKLFEAEDTWVSWYTTQRPYGKTAQSVITEYKEMLEK